MLYYMLAAHLFYQRQHTTLHVLYAIAQLSLWPQTLHYITLHYTKHNKQSKQSSAFLSACHLPNKAATMVTMETRL